MYSTIVFGLGSVLPKIDSTKRYKKKQKEAKRDKNKQKQRNKIKQTKTSKQKQANKNKQKEAKRFKINVVCIDEPIVSVAMSTQYASEKSFEVEADSVTALFLTQVGLRAA